MMRGTQIEVGFEKRADKNDRVEAAKKNLKVRDLGGVSCPSRNRKMERTPKNPAKVSLSPETQATDST